MICQEARDLIKHSRLDKGAYLDAVVKMNLTDEGQVEQVRAHLALDHQPPKAKTRTLGRNDDVAAVVGKLRALYHDDLLAEIRRAL